LKAHFNIILLSKPACSKWSLYLGFTHQNPTSNYPLTHTCYLARPNHSY
jgi:hypothetical protein